MPSHKPLSPAHWLAGLTLGVPLGWFAFQMGWMLTTLARQNPVRTLATHVNHGPRGHHTLATTETAHYTMTHTLTDGIERIHYLPKNPRFATPIVFQHGMWHGAWCWDLWQAHLAELGWESTAHSLPGHAGSPVQRPIRLCTLDYYLAFLRDEIARQPRKPILITHSMGGALAQWYLKYIGDDLPAIVFAASWVATTPILEGALSIIRNDPLLAPLTSLSWDATPWIRTPQIAANFLITPGAAYSPEALHMRLTPESVLLVYQHQPPFWSPPPQPTHTPLLWLGATRDITVTEAGSRRSAARYGATYYRVPDAGHNIMMEHNWRATADVVHEWLSANVRA